MPMGRLKGVSRGEMPSLRVGFAAGLLNGRWYSEKRDGDVEKSKGSAEKSSWDIFEP